MTSTPALHLVPPPVEETKAERKRRLNLESQRRCRAANPEKARAAAVRYREANPERWKAIKRRYIESHPDAWRETRARKPEKYAAIAWRTALRQYGLTIADYDRMLFEQNGVCKICRRPESVVHRGKLRRLSVDHCHTTKRVRGLLGALCNHAIGQMQDDPARLRAAADYLEKA